MTIGKLARNVTVGFVIGLLALGLLPFLLIYNFAELVNGVELDATPLFLLMRKWLGDGPSEAAKADAAASDDAS
ncbi:hypothetical protein IDH44_03565 [Paenibacillus sp. IB182496]|uniref:Uncharacterized protein n=1 Tax=Paenibacillus sabuli TaxID=2772509 RepID=A0A927BPD2_9BACL|nr:hypothetical protein [Paenibacillus sabuli]MBD2844256.1 hypothetical protein [Paenibacillus sabuli]